MGERKLAGAVFVWLFSTAEIVAGSGVWGMVVLSVTLVKISVIYIVADI